MATISIDDLGRLGAWKDRHGGRQALQCGLSADKAASLYVHELKTLANGRFSLTFPTLLGDFGQRLAELVNGERLP